MLKPRSRANQLICAIDRTPFVNVAIVLSALFLIIVISIPQPHHGAGVDLAKVIHPVSMQAADQEGAMMVAVRPDGKVFFGSDPILPRDLSTKIRDRASLRGTEQKVYLRADARARYGSVKEVVDAIHDAGIEKVGILVEQRRTPSSTP